VVEDDDGELGQKRSMPGPNKKRGKDYRVRYEKVVPKPQPAPEATGDTDGSAVKTEAPEATATAEPTEVSPSMETLESNLSELAISEDKVTEHESPF